MTFTRSLLVEGLGWAATAVFVGSYFFTRDGILVRVQMLGAVMWVTYGALMRAPPVVVANLLVLAAAGWKAWKLRRATSAHGPAPAPAHSRPGVEAG
jgi:hypothetical protein